VGLRRNLERFSIFLDALRSGSELIARTPSSSPLFLPSIRVSQANPNIIAVDMSMLRTLQKMTQLPPPRLAPTHVSRNVSLASVTASVPSSQERHFRFSTTVPAAYPCRRSRHRRSVLPKFTLVQEEILLTA
jgi:hypothetical protein